MSFRFDCGTVKAITVINDSIYHVLCAGMSESSNILFQWGTFLAEKFPDLSDLHSLVTSVSAL